MDKNLVVSLDEIKGIRLQCKECGSEAVVSPKNNYLYGHTCPQGHPWQEKPFNQHDNIYMFLNQSQGGNYILERWQRSGSFHHQCVGSGL